MQKDLFFSDRPISQSLLDEDSLLTPKLMENFGQIIVKESNELECMDSDTVYLRESILYQKCTGDKILEATLRIYKKLLPKQFIKDLKFTSTPFGMLIKKYGIATRVASRQIVINIDPKSHLIRIGRSHLITKSESHEVICLVKELLVTEEKLVTSKKSYRSLQSQVT